MSLINKIKHPQNNYTNLYDQARFKLTWRVSMVILISMIIFSIATAFLAPAYLFVVLVSLFAIGGIVGIILKTQKYELAAKLFLILGCIISSAGLFLIQDMIHIVDLI